MFTTFLLAKPQGFTSVKNVGVQSQKTKTLITLTNHYNYHSGIIDFNVLHVLAKVPDTKTVNSHFTTSYQTECKYCTAILGPKLYSIGHTDY